MKIPLIPRLKTWVLCSNLYNVIDFYISQTAVPTKRKGWKSKSLSKSSIVVDEENIQEINLRLPPISNMEKEEAEEYIKEILIEREVGVVLKLTDDPGGGFTPHLQKENVSLNEFSRIINIVTNQLVPELYS